MAETEEDLVFHARDQRMTVSSSTVDKIPFLEALMAGRVNTIKNESDEPIIDRDPILVGAVLAFATSGNPFHLFAKLPASSCAREMLAELDFFLVDPPTVRAVDDASFKHQLRDVSDEYDRICRRGPIERTRTADRHSARKAAAELAVGLELGKYNSVETRNQLYNSILFVLSHPRTFGPRLRHHVWQLASKNVQLTLRQRNALESWVDRLSDDSSDKSDKSISSRSSDVYDGYDSEGSFCYYSD